MTEISLQAPAKINLVLRVLGRRRDGYHELETWMQKLSFCDTLNVSILDTPGVKLHCCGADLPADRSNLVWRAADLFFKKSERARGKGVSIQLHKLIPVAAGLGGGSSDAGTLLQGLNNHFNNEFSREVLLAMALQLGADVPFFVIDALSVLATGVGEKMVPVSPLTNCTFILVNPAISVSTAEVFEKFALTRANKNSTLTGSQKLEPGKLCLSDCENDLEEVTVKDFPVINTIKRELSSLGADKVLMSGSGPTVFGVFLDDRKDREIAIENAAFRLRQKFGEKVYIA